MSIPIDDGDTFALGDQRRSRHGDVVDQAEAHALALLGVVSRGTDGSETEIGLSCLNRLDGCHAGTGGEAGCLPRCRRDIGVGVEGASTVEGHRLNPLEVILFVNGEEFLPGCRAGLDADHLNAAGLDPRESSADSVRSLRMLPWSHVAQT